MAQIPETVIQDIVAKADIVDVISQYVVLTKKGSDYIGKCPFHEEKTGSFTVSKNKKIYHCFGCNKTGDVIKFLVEYEKIAFPEAIKRLAAVCHITLDTNYQVKIPASKMSEHNQALDAFEYKAKSFTKYELSMLGKDISAEICEKHFNLYSVEYYITKKNDKGKSWKIASTDDFPIFIYDYGTWVKIYQPLSADFRFSYWGEKPDTYIFSDNKTAKLLTSARNGSLPSTGGADGEEDNRLNDLVICSGGSDALNVYANGFNVCWLNSETAELEDYEYRKLLAPICKNLYILYDIDETGIRQANSIALRYLDIKVVRLPDDLKKFKDRKGKQCKDVKDFFMYYRNSRHRRIGHFFKMIVQTSMPLCFWQVKYDNKGEFKGYDINNEQLYGFLNAVGLYTIESKQEKRGFKYVYIQDNIVREINEEQMQTFVNHLLIQFVRENIEYYNINLLNSIHRSNQVKLASLEKIRKIDLDFKSYGIDHDFIFFRNAALRITSKGLELVQLDKIGKYTFDFKIIDHDFNVIDAPFEIEYTSEFKNLIGRLHSISHHDIAYKELKSEVDNYNDLNKFELKINDDKFSFLQYIFNTGRVYWKKREAGEALTEQEIKEQNLHFINKVTAIGYMLYRYKDPSRAYMIYGMETEQSSIGKHLGGTGKSLFFNSIENVRKMAFIDGQKRNIDQNETLFSEVKEKVTDFVYIDDLNKNFDLHLLMPTITGKMEVRALYSNKIVLDFQDSPKFGATSNHAVGNFDASLRRRTWFTAFCNYYHTEDKLRGVEERSPRTEFGKNLIIDYDKEEMNKFYSFMAYCLHTYLKFRVRINPPMDSIEKRNIQRVLGDEFIYWAEDYFTDDKLNVDLEKTELFEAYKKTMPQKFADMVKMRTFKEKLQLYCEFKGYVFNPTELLITEAEKDRNEIRKYRDNKDLYFFHIRNTNHAPQRQDISNPQIDGIGKNKNSDFVEMDKEF